MNRWPFHLCVLCSLCVAMLAGCRGSPPPTIDGILSANPDQFARVTRDPATYRVQVLLSEVIPGRDGSPVLRRSAYRAGAEYFYPASAIKLCAAVAAVQKLEALAASDPGGEPDLNTPLAFLPANPGEPILDQDPSNLDGGRITVGHEIRKLFLVSDNEAFNRLYDFVGHRELNEQMRAIGLDSVVINHRLSAPRSRDNLRTPPIEFTTRGGKVTVPARDSDLALRNRADRGLQVGVGHMVGEQRREEPMDFTSRNGIGLGELQDLLVLLVRPDIRIERPALHISDAHRHFIRETMAEYPGDSGNPIYDRTSYPDDWGKFFLPGLLRVCEKEDLIIRNKVGQAYGFTIDNAYIENTRLGTAFFLTAVIYSNEDGILNDDRYEYESMALPFMADLGEAVARGLWTNPE